MVGLVAAGFGVVLAAAYFGIGRFSCPIQERLPLRELDNGAVVATIVRGWRASGRD